MSEVDVFAPEPAGAEPEPSHEAPVDDAVVAEDAGVEPVVEGETIELDPWESLKEKGYDPEKLEKSFTRFTQELEGVKAKEKDLLPYQQLKQMMDDDPRLLSAIEKALNEPLEGEDEVDVLRRELNSLKTNMATEREVGSLREYVSGKDYPEFDEREVINYAIKHNLGSLKAAYNDMNLDAIVEAERGKTLGELKRGQNARSVTASAGTQKGAPTFSQEQIASMSSKEFMENRTAIYAYYDSLRK